MIINLVRVSNLLEVTLVHNSDTIGHIESFFLIVSDINKGDAQLLLQLLEFNLHLSAETEVESTEWLVEKENVRLVYDSTCNSNTLTLTA